MADEIKNIRASSEYSFDSEECAHYGEDFRLRAVSEMISVSAPPPYETAGGFIGGDDGEGIGFSVKQGKPSKERDVIEMTALASVAVAEDGRIEVRYDDAVDPDEPPVGTCISFDPDCPGLVTLERRGVIRSVMLFEEGRYRRCEYITPYMTFEMCVYGRKVDNRLTAEGGTLELDYVIEIKGAASQRVKMSVEIVKI